jgi:hypothetical protein
VKSVTSFQSLCQQYASIVGGKAEVKEGICFVTFPRNLTITVQGQLSSSPLVHNVIFSFDSPNREGQAINEVNLPLLQHEINPVIAMAKEKDIQVAALHNHWIYVQPLVLGLHLQSIEHPLAFAKKMQRIVSFLKGGINYASYGTTL